MTSWSKEYKKFIQCDMKCHAFLAILEITLQLYIHVRIDKKRKKKKRKKKTKNDKVKKAMVTGKLCFSIRIYLTKFNTVAASLTHNG